jgi:site-specific recombinase XerD
MGESQFVFPASNGDSHFQGTERIWAKVKERAGFPNLRLHDLRHSFASMGLARGDALPVIGAILGHADVNTTKRYAHLADDPVKFAADNIARTIQAALSGRVGAAVVSVAASRRRR